MRGRLWLGMGFVLIAAVLLVACQPAPAPVTVTEEVAKTEAPEATSPPEEASLSTESQAAEPAAEIAHTSEPSSQSGLEAERAYPSPLELVAPNPYPAPEGSEEVSWEQAQTLIMSGEVEQVYQTVSRQVILTLKDGRVLVADQPEMNAVFAVVENCGEPCFDIRKITE